MKIKKSQYSIWAPIIRKKVNEEKIKKEENGEELTREERKSIIKKEKTKCRRKATWIAITAALGITAGAKGVKLLEAPKENNIKVEEQKNTEDKRKNFYEKNKVEVTPSVESKKDEIGVEDILKEYDYNIEKEDIGYIKSRPQFMTIDLNSKYVADYKEKTKASDYITEQNRIDNMYSIINKKDNTIITTLGIIDEKYVNIDTKQVKVSSKEYLQGKKVIDISKDKKGKDKTQEELKKLYNNIQNEYEQAKEQKENEER